MKKQPKKKFDRNAHRAAALGKLFDRMKLRNVRELSAREQEYVLAVSQLTQIVKTGEDGEKVVVREGVLTINGYEPTELIRKVVQ